MISDKPVIAVLGLGEAGSLIARDLVDRGAVVRGWDPDLHGDLSRIPIAESALCALEGADFVLSVNWASVAQDVARDALPRLGPQSVYAEFNTSGPKLKRAIAAIVESVGARFVDVAMMQVVPGYGVKVPSLVSGSGAEAFAEVFRDFGMPVEVVNDVAGDAAARKLVRSVFVKSFATAVCEGVEAARALGLEDWMFDEIERFMKTSDGSIARRYYDGTFKHAVRRGKEMRAVEEMLLDLGVAPTMSRASAEVHERLASEKQPVPK